MGTYAIQTMGCQMNERDSETIAGLLEQMGYTGAAGREDADIIIVNTCSVRENADNRFFGLLGRLKHIKTRRPDTIVAACGCMMQQEHIVGRINDKHAWVDLIFGTHNIDALPDMIEEVLRSRGPTQSGPEGIKPGNAKQGKAKPRAHILQARGEIAEGLPARRAFSFKASVNIMYGCNNFCTYCIVPYTRGREISRDAESILAEVRDLALAGTKEILLLGQNVNSYAGAVGGGSGRGGNEVSMGGNAESLSGSRMGFADLIDSVGKIPGIERIRFMTSHPKDLSSKLIDRYGPEAAGGARHLCPSIHLPVQSGSSRVLERMNRHYTKEDYLALAGKLRAANPGIVLTTDFIVGFPGESEEDFAETMALIERVRFDAAFTFLFSPRKGTPAADYGEQVPDAVKHERFDRMTGRLNAITLEKNRLYVGSLQDVLVEGPSKNAPDMLSGRTFGGKLVSFPAPAPQANMTAPIGKIVPVRITAVNTFSFMGLIEND
ncbi:MAG: MiaB/RimO family radical SAM methylthiotransferase [Clostridiales Family XIII bacterium]|jgi:tRNA-2-methylthio-N6-dimethylallyladenosine synthase|nr:MiaB/RimO family radical SAM methylthiotransferase [Clostridiales Family XIII bacterium]